MRSYGFVWSLAHVCLLGVGSLHRGATSNFPTVFPNGIHADEHYRPDWIGAIGAGIAALLSFSIAKGLVKGKSNRPMFYLVLGLCAFVLSLTIREVLRRFGI